MRGELLTGAGRGGSLAASAMWLAFALPTLAALQSWYQGVIVHSRRTRGITESMAVSLLATALVLAAGVALGRWSGLYVAFAGMLAGNAAQVVWMRLRARPALAVLAASERPDAGAPEPAEAVGA